MDTHTTELVVCPACGRRSPPTRKDCMYCGDALPSAQASAGAVVPAVKSSVRPGGGHASAAAAPPFGGRGPASPPRPGRPGAGRQAAAAETVPAEEVVVARVVGCPCCGGEYGAHGIAVEAWEDRGTTFTGKHQWLVRSRTVPGVCAACRGSVRRSRLLATLLVLAPFLLLATPLGATRQPSFAYAIPLILYGLHLLRWPGYNWADIVLYGAGLEAELGPWIPRGSQSPDKVRFPVGFLHAFARLALSPFLALAGLLLGSLAQ